MTVTKKDDDSGDYLLKQYSLESYEMTFEEVVRSQKGDGPYMKLKEIEQNDKGDKYIIAFNDDGYFKVRTFGKDCDPETKFRDQWEIENSEIDVNALLGLNDHTMCN